MRVNGNSTAVLGVNPRCSARSPRDRPGVERALAGRGRRRGRRLLHDGHAGQAPARRHGRRRRADARSGSAWWPSARWASAGSTPWSRTQSPQARRPAGNAIVVSVAPADFTADVDAVGKADPHGAGVEKLVSLVRHRDGRWYGGRRQAVESAETARHALEAMLKAAMSREGMPYVWGAAGPNAFDCSGLVQWSLAQAGMVMPRVAADQALSGPGRAGEPVAARRPALLPH